MSTIDTDDLSMRTRLAELDRIYAHTHQLVADLNRVNAQTQQANADADRKRQEMAFAPWQIALSLLTLTAAAFAAGAAFMKLLGVA